MTLTPNFTLHELTFSGTAVKLKIDNTPPPETVARLKATARMLEKVRALLGAPVVVSSGYRSKLLNTAVGGSSTSDHLTGDAADITVPKFGSPDKVASYLAMDLDELGIGQLILEKFKTSQWVHVSTRVPSKAQNRILTITESGTTSGIRSIK